MFGARESELREKLDEISQLPLQDRAAALSELHDELLSELQREDSADF